MGKCSAARRLSRSSAYRRHFVVVRCRDLSPADFEVHKHNLLASEGTVYLDEIGDLSRECQKSLLEALRRLESSQNGGSIARFASGTPTELEAAVHAGRFNEELYYRVAGVGLRLPPLRHRRQDLPSLMKFFLSNCALELGRDVPSLSAGTQQLFLDYDWPGNIPELKDAARAIVVLGDESLAMGGLRSVLSKVHRTERDEPVSLREAAKAASREAERELILRTLSRTQWNRRRAAQNLNISYKALLYKLKQMGESKPVLPESGRLS